MIKKRHQGFTLPELMTSIGVAGVLASLATPSFSAMVERNRISTTTHQLMSSLFLMRSEAAKRGFDVSICAVDSTGAACDSTATDFSNGWIVFTDYRTPSPVKLRSNGMFDAGVLFDTDGDGVGDMPEEILAYSDAMPEGLTIYSNHNNALNTLTYCPTGDLSNRVGFGLSFFVAKDDIPKASVKISMTGRIRSCTIKTGKTNC